MTRPLGGRLRGAETAEDVAAGARAEQAVRAVARKHLVPELLFEWHVASENCRGNKPFQQVVIPAVAVASREPEKPRVSVRLEYRAYDVRLRSEPVRVRTVATLEIERRQGPSARIRSRTCSATSGLSSRTRGCFGLHGALNHGYSLIATNERPLFAASKISRHS